MPKKIQNDFLEREVLTTICKEMYLLYFESAISVEQSKAAAYTLLILVL